MPLLVLWHGFMDFRQRMTSQSSRLVADLAPANSAKRGEFKRHFESFHSFRASFQIFSEGYVLGMALHVYCLGDMEKESESTWPEYHRIPMKTREMNLLKIC